LMRPLPLPPAGPSTLRQRPLDRHGPSSPSLPLTGSTQEVLGRDSSIGFEHR
jgi:hypothetical protein